MLKTIKSILSGLDGAARLTGVAANLALIVVFAWATNEFYGKAGSAWSRIGDIPSMEVAFLMAWVTDPAIADRLIAMGSFWAYAVATIGCGWMTILGGRWAYHLVLAIIQSLRSQTDKAMA